MHLQITEAPKYETTNGTPVPSEQKGRAQFQIQVTKTAAPRRPKRRQQTHTFDPKCNITRRSQNFQQMHTQCHRPKHKTTNNRTNDKQQEQESNGWQKCQLWRADWIPNVKKSTLPAATNHLTPNTRSQEGPNSSKCAHRAIDQNTRLPTTEQTTNNRNRKAMAGRNANYGKQIESQTHRKSTLPAAKNPFQSIETHVPTTILHSGSTRSVPAP